MEHRPQVMREIHIDQPEATGRVTPDVVDFDRRLPGNGGAARTKCTPGSGPQTAMPIVLSCDNVPDRRVTQGGAALRPTRPIMIFAKRTQTIGNRSLGSVGPVGVPYARQAVGRNPAGRDPR